MRWFLMFMLICSTSYAVPVRAVYKPDDKVVIIYPVPGMDYNTTCDETMQELGLTGCEYDDIDSEDLPARTDRDYWRGDKLSGITINQPIKDYYNNLLAEEAMIEAEKEKLAIDSLVSQGKMEAR